MSLKARKKRQKNCGYKHGTFLCLVTGCKNFLTKKELQIKMSSLMPLTFNAVELYVVTINEKPWTRDREVCKALQYDAKTSKTANIIRGQCSPENITQNYQLIGFVSKTKPVNWPKDLQKYNIYINEEGMTELLVGSQQQLAKEIAEYMGIKIIGYKYVPKEAGTIYTIQNVFQGISMKQQFGIGPYRIGL